MPVSNTQAGTPASPPKSQVPRSDEESRRSEDEALLPEPLRTPDTLRPPAEAKAKPEAGADVPSRTPEPPTGDADPAENQDPAAGLEPGLLPQSMLDDDAREFIRPRRTPGSLAFGAMRRMDSPPPTLQPAVVPTDAVAPEPDEGREVFPAVAAGEEIGDETALGPARRRFVARRPTSADPLVPATD